MSGSESLLLIDAGNTRIKGSWYDDSGLRRLFSIATERATDSVSGVLDDLADAPEALFISSVVRGVPELFRNQAVERWGVEPILADANMPVGVSVDVPRPETVGIDRLLMAGEAYTQVKGSVIIVGAGTAITVDVVTDAGVYVGGTISAGLRTAAWSLSARTSLLPEVDLGRIPEGVPQTTEESITAGIAIGAAGSIDRLVRELGGRAGLEEYKVILTGGDVDLLSPYVDFPHTTADDLVALGLAHTYERLRPESDRSDG